MRGCQTPDARRQSPVASGQAPVTGRIKGPACGRLCSCRNWRLASDSRRLPSLQLLAARMPGTARAYHRVEEELRFSLHAVTSGLWRQVWRRCRDRGHVRKQLPLVWESPLRLPAQGASRRRWAPELSRLGIQCREGDHALYIPPQPGLSTRLGSFVAAYPEDAGYKLLKNPGSPEKARYLGDLRRITWTESTLVGVAQDLVPVANYLHELKLAPRLYDIARLDAGASTHTMYVVQHIEGCCPAEVECQAFVRRLEQLVSEKKIALARPDWRREPDFRCPDCSGNLLKSVHGPGLYYVDFQNFLIPHGAAGDRRNQSSDRSGRRRMRAPGAGGLTPGIWKLLSRQGIDMKGRLFLEIGCGDGTRLAEALSEGAGWAVGWDRPEMTGQARRRLGAQGYTRYDLIGVEPSEERPMRSDIPPHLFSALEDSVFLASAAWGPIDPARLAALPWRALVYELTAGEVLDEGSSITRQLQTMARAEWVRMVEGGDPVSEVGPLAIFLRRRSPAPGDDH
jgi:hypothetical protein